MHSTTFINALRHVMRKDVCENASTSGGHAELFVFLWFRFDCYFASDLDLPKHMSLLPVKERS